MSRVIIAFSSFLLCVSAIAGGARDSWWSVQPVAKPSVPDADSNWGRNSVDRFVSEKLRPHELPPSPEASPRAQCRRLFFGLTGLPPSLEQMDAFLSATEVNRDAAYEALVDELLNSPAYGERWARHWLDIAHYADTHGFERDRPRDHAWPYRDYVIRSLIEDKPYDQFLREQIAGDVLSPDNPDSVVATGFLAAGPWDLVGQEETKSPPQRRAARALDLDDMVTQVMTSTVSMTVNCARCHDHKLDPISQKEYYQLVSIFAGLNRKDRPAGEAFTLQHRNKVRQLGKELREVETEIARIQPPAVDLANLVGENEKGRGIDPRTGAVQIEPQGSLKDIAPNVFVPCPQNVYVDGVFIPSGGVTTISSSGLVARDLPDSSGGAWDAIRNGPVNSQFSTVLGGTDYNKGDHSLLGLHANAGITFDLDEVRKRHELGAIRFSAVAAYGGAEEDRYAAAFHVLLDGVKLAGDVLRRKAGATPIELDIPAKARFLTLISTDAGGEISHDQISFGDPRLEPTARKQLRPDEQSKLNDLRQKRNALKTKLSKFSQNPKVYGVVADREPPSVHLLERGDPESPGEEVAPGTLSWVSSLPAAIGARDMPEANRRIALAEWIANPGNPLTRRVIVNRLWHWHFGQGLVTTPSDFGNAGQRPSHPQLLDFLAVKLLEERWSLKAIHKLILMSATYRQSTKSRDVAMAVDAGNRLLWRMNPRRLEAEEVRDAVLAVSGNLNREMFGPGYRDFDYKEAYAPVYRHKTADSTELWRRSIYRFVVRSTPHRFMNALDCPDPAVMTPKRLTTTTAAQSLALFNNDFMLKQAGYFAERLGSTTENLDEQVVTGFRLAFGREPSNEELIAAKELINDSGLATFCRALFNANEFVYLD